LAVVREGLSKRTEYIRYNAIDWATSIYIVAVDNQFNIVNFATAIGCVFNTVTTPFAIHKSGPLQKDELYGNIDVSFACTAFIPHNPIYYDTFNHLTGFNPSNLVDTQGSGYILQHPARISEAGIVKTSKIAKMKSVFLQTGVFEENRKGTGVDPHRVLDIDSTGMTAQTDSGTKTIYGKFPYKGISEIVALSPGVYVVTDKNDPTKINYKLGFSY